MSARLCSVDGCEKRHDAWGYCRAHGARWKRHGSPTGRPASPIQDYFFATVLTHTGDACLTWPYGKQGAGYGEIVLDGRRRHVHRVVCEYVNGPPPTDSHEAAHSCGNGHLACVSQSHLRWATKKENAADRKLHGTDTFGEKNGYSILKEADVHKIRELWPDTSQADLAQQYGVTRQAIWLVVHHKNWAWL